LLLILCDVINTLRIVHYKMYLNYLTCYAARAGTGLGMVGRRVINIGGVFCVIHLLNKSCLITITCVTFIPWKLTWRFVNSEISPGVPSCVVYIGCQGLTESTLVEDVRLSRKVLYHFAIFVIVNEILIFKDCRKAPIQWVTVID